MDKAPIRAWDAKYMGEAVVAQTLSAVARLTRGIRVPPIFEEIERTASPDWRMLEAGSGTGRLTLALTSRIRVQGIGVDYSRAAVESSREAARRLSISAEFLQAELRALPFPDAKFELVFSDSVIEHIPEYLQVLNEVARVTKPGGWVLVSVPNRLRPDGWDLHRLIHRPSYPQTSFTPWRLRKDLRRVGLLPSRMFGGDAFMLGWVGSVAPGRRSTATGQEAVKERRLRKTLRRLLAPTFPEWFRIDIGCVARKI